MEEQTQQKEIARLQELELKLFIIEFNKGSQLDRSFGQDIKPETKQEFRKKLIDACFRLKAAVDNNTITNLQIRNEIDSLKEISSKISYGQAQKVINVFMKQYCFVSNQLERINELDCPLDSTTMKGCCIKNRTMKSITREEYIDCQQEFQKECDIRILRDKKYDENRERNFLALKSNE